MEIYVIKRRTLMINLIVVFLMSSYFAFCYYNDFKYYKLAIDILPKLENIFYKDACLSNSYIYTRENYIRNELVLMASGSPGSGIATGCLKYEDNFRQLR